MRYILFLLLSFSFISACATTNYYSQAINSWRGASADKLIERWGEPNEIATSVRGNKVLVYTTERRLSNPPLANPPAAVVSGPRGSHIVTSVSQPMQQNPPIIECTTAFEVDKQNRIIATTYFGRNCPTDEQITNVLGQ